MTLQEVVPRLFGTNGVRGIVNTPAMDCRFATRLGMAIGTFMKGPVLIGTDARTSSEMLKAACAAGAMATGCEILDCGVLPTPALQYSVKITDSISGGIVITASHNPPEFNGIKCVDGDGTEMARDNEERIERIFHSGDFRTATWEQIGRSSVNDRAIPTYLDSVVSLIDAEAVRLAHLRVALDCSNGAGAAVTPKILERLGVEYVTLNADLNGAFPGHNSEPTPDNARDLVELVKKGGFDLGIIHDGDADRTIFVGDTGSYMHGDRSLAIAAHYACLENDGGLVVTTVGSSKCVEDAVKMAGGRMMFTRVGSPVVARAMIEHGAIFGGEENGGLIFPELQHCRDGAMAAARLIEIVAKHGKMSELQAMIPAYSQYKTKTSCPDELKDAVIKELSESAKDEKVDMTDGMKVLFDDGWVLIRPSGTEPIVRIFSEASSPDRAKEIAERFRQHVAQIVDA
ncbi:MAG: phosphoglucosamine mutase [Methanobacteriota archaeon]|nr:MAG: phosphoglucosamine mutase [Euryarchaeota archaeon]